MNTKIQPILKLLPEHGFELIHIVSGNTLNLIFCYKLFALLLKKKNSDKKKDIKFL